MPDDLTSKQQAVLAELLRAVDALDDWRKALWLEPENPALSMFVDAWVLGCQWGSGAPTRNLAVQAVYERVKASAPAVGATEISATTEPWTRSVNEA